MCLGEDPRNGGLVLGLLLVPWALQGEISVGLETRRLSSKGL